jgi:hypothetical protein
MSDAEFDLWAEMDRRDRMIGHRKAPEGSPCQDCNAAFAKEMRAIGRCDGKYPGEVGFVDPQRPWKHPTEAARLEARRRTSRESYLRQKAATA